MVSVKRRSDACVGKQLRVSRKGMKGVCGMNGGCVWKEWWICTEGMVAA